MIGVGIPFKRPPLGIVKNGLVAMYMPYKQYAEGKTGQTLYNEKKDYLPVTNMVVNGDFRSGTQGWSAGIGSITAANKTLKLAAEGNVYNFAWANPSPNIYLTEGHEYYYTATMTANNENITKLTMWTPSVVTTQVKNPIVGYPYKLKSIRSAVAGDYIRLYYYVDTLENTPGTSININNVSLIDLTATFGAGNEPTLEQCDVIFPDWFDGTQNMLLPLNNGRLGSSSDSDTNDPTFKGQGLTFDGDDFVAIPRVTLSKGVTFVSIFTPDNISGTRVHLGSNQHTYDGISSSKIRASEVYNNVQRIVASSMILEADKPYFMTSRRSYGLFDITVNGIKDSYPTPDDIAYNPGNYSIRSLGCYTPGSACFSGNLSFAAIYDRILTDAEIERNYRVLKREMAKVGVNI